MISESKYNELPSWQKIGMRPCICGGATALFYDENENYHVECCNCPRITLFKAKSMTEAKEHWKTSPHCLDMGWGVCDMRLTASKMEVIKWAVLHQNRRDL